jgi:5-methylcytosine-specific restriction protein A
MRLSARKRGYNARWDRESREYLRNNPLCIRCRGRGRVSPSQVVDHIVPHKGDMALFWDRTNWQPLCIPCHSGPKQSEERIGYSKEIGKDGWPIDPRHPANKI